MTTKQVNHGSRRARRQVVGETGGRAAGQPEPAWQRMARRRRRRALVLAAVIAAAVLAVTIAVNGRGGGQAVNSQGPAVGSLGPTGTFTTADGRAVDVASLRGKPALLWFVATWCTSCQVGTQVLASQIGQLAARGVKVVELELYNNLGGQGPDIDTFGRQYAGPAFRAPNWVWGTASQDLSFAYNPKGYLDIYYLLDAQGRIRYINGSPASTMDQLLQAAAQLGGSSTP